MVDGMSVEQFENEIATRKSFSEGYHFGAAGQNNGMNPYAENTLDYFCFASGVAHFE